METKMMTDNADDSRNPSRRRPEKPGGAGQSSDPKTKQTNITRQIHRLFQLERVDRALGLRNRGNKEPLDELLGFDGNDAEDAQSLKPDEHDKPNNSSQ
jgi:hypothetical protein